MSNEQNWSESTRRVENLSESTRRVENLHKWRGLKALVHDAVEHGSRAVERVHLDTSRRPFAILEHVPIVAGPSKVVHVVHDALVTSSYAAVRVVNAVVGKVADVALDMLDEKPGTDLAKIERD